MIKTMQSSAMRYFLVAAVSVGLTSTALAILDGGSREARGSAAVAQAEKDRHPDWVEKVRPHSTSISKMSTVSLVGQIGLVSGSRSSDSNCSGCMGTIGLESIVLNNNIKQVQSAYGAYIEATRDRGNPGTTHGAEINVINKSALVAANPTAMHGTGITPALWLASGGEAKVQPATMAMGITSNGAKFDKGIVFQDGALTTRVDAKQEAISLPHRSAISFYDTKGNIVANIYGQGTYTGSAVNLRFDAGKLVIEKVDGTPILTVEQNGLRIGNTIGVSCSGPPSADYKVITGVVTHC